MTTHIYHTHRQLARAHYAHAANHFAKESPSEAAVLRGEHEHSPSRVTRHHALERSAVDRIARHADRIVHTRHAQIKAKHSGKEGYDHYVAKDHKALGDFHAHKARAMEGHASRHEHEQHHMPAGRSLVHPEPKERHHNEQEQHHMPAGRSLVHPE